MFSMPRRRIRKPLDADECRRRQELYNMVEIRRKKRNENLQKKWVISSESTTYPDHSNNSISFSIRIQGIEKEPVVIFSEIQDVINLAEKEICSRYVVSVLSKANIHNSIQNHIVPKLTKELVSLHNIHRDHGFIVKLEVEASLCEEEGPDKDCIICGEELSLYGLTETETRLVTVKAYAIPTSSVGHLSTVIIKRDLEREECIVDKLDGSVSSIKTYPVLPEIRLSFRNFTTEYVHQVIQYQFHDPILSRQISDQIVMEAQRHQNVDFPQQTLFLEVYVKLTEKVPKQETLVSTSGAKAILQVYRCKHVFHKSCLCDWVKAHNSCPLCCCKIREDSE